MNLPESNLSQALRDLGAASPQSAPPELGVHLRKEFARHHARRRLKRTVFVVGVAASLSLFFAWQRFSYRVKPMTAAVSPASSQSSAPPPDVTASSASTAQALPRIPSSVSRTRARTHSTKHVRPRNIGGATDGATIASGDFVALPTFDPAIPIVESRAVRLDLPGSDLQLMGYPVNGELMHRRVLTDVLVGQDGTPYAVRLVQTRNTH